MVKFDFDIKEFNKDVKKFTKDSGKLTGVAVRKIGFDLLGGILGGELKGGQFTFKNRIIGTGRKYLGLKVGSVVTGRHPVDTGRSRAGWYASVNGLKGRSRFNWEKGSKNIKSKMVAKGKREGRFVDKSKSLTAPYIELINGVPYIVFLEYGWSKQAPMGMVRIAIRKMRGRMPKLITEEYMYLWNTFKF